MSHQLHILTEHEVNHNRNKYNDMVAKKVSLIAYGQQTTGEVKRMFEDENSFHLEVHHEPVNFEGGTYSFCELAARKIDDFGSLNSVTIIQE